MSDSLHARLAVLARQRWLNWMWRVAVTLLLVTWIFSRLDLEQFTHVVIAPRWDALIGVALASIVFIVLGGVKVWVLLRALAPIPLPPVIAYYFLATAFGSFTPGAVGDFSIAVLLRRERVPVHQGLSVMLLDRVITLAAYLLIFVPCTVSVLWVANYLYLFLPGAVLVVVLIGWRWLYARVPVDRMVRRFPAIGQFLAALAELLEGHQGNLLGNIGLTLLRSIVAGIGVQLALLAAGQSGDILPITCISNSLSVLTLLPITLGGIGVYEGGGIFLFERIGLSREAVLAGLLYQRAYIVLSALLIMAVYLVLAVLHRGAFFRRSSDQSEKEKR